MDKSVYYPDRHSIITSLPRRHLLAWRALTECLALAKRTASKEVIDHIHAARRDYDHQIITEVDQALKDAGWNETRPPDLWWEWS